MQTKLRHERAVAEASANAAAEAVAQVAAKAAAEAAAQAAAESARVFAKLQMDVIRYNVINVQANAVYLHSGFSAERSCAGQMLLFS